MTAIFAFFYVAPLVWQLILAGLIFSYIAHSFLLVLEDTAAGGDVVVWPTEHWLDWIGDLLYLVGLSFLWLWPVFVACKLTDAPSWVFLAAMAAYAWLIFPITVLSSLSGNSKWAILRPFILWRLARNIHYVAAFYVFSTSIVALCFGLFGAGVFFGFLWVPDIDPAEPAWIFVKLSVILGQVFFLPLSAMFTGVGLLLYSRMLGRLGYLISRAPRTTESEEIEDEFDDDRAETEKSAEPEQVLVHAAAGREEAYALAPASDLGPSFAEPAPVEQLSAQEVALIAKQRVGIESHAKLDMSVLMGALPQDPSAEESAEAKTWRPWTGILSFPFYRTSLRPLIWLSMGIMAVCAMIVIPVLLDF